jgi:hypothetical protein
MSLHFSAQSALGSDEGEKALAEPLGSGSITGEPEHLYDAFCGTEAGVLLILAKIVQRLSLSFETYPAQFLQIWASLVDFAGLVPGPVDQDHLADAGQVIPCFVNRTGVDQCNSSGIDLLKQTGWRVHAVPWDLFSPIAHDINYQLTCIGTFAELLGMRQQGKFHLVFKDTFRYPVL